MKRIILYILLLTGTCVFAEEKTYVNDWQRMNLPDSTDFFMVNTKADGRIWSSQYWFTDKGMLKEFRSYVDMKELLYIWEASSDNREEGMQLMPEGGFTEDSVTTLTIVPIEVDEYDDCISSVYGGMMAYISPVEGERGVWYLRYVDHCTDASLFGDSMSEEDCEKVSRQDPPYGLVTAKELTFHTRNYGGETIPIYAEPNENSRVVKKIKREYTNLHPYALDLENGMVLIRYRGRWGWISLFWVCGNPYTNCC